MKITLAGPGGAPQERVSCAMALLPQIVLGGAPSLVHCHRMFDRYGIVQFAHGPTPNLDYGYCLDDNARAFLAAIIVLYLDPGHAFAQEIGSSSLAFAEACRRPDGRFHNLMAEDGSFTDEIGSQDSLGRLIWACGVGACCAPQPQWRERASVLLEAALERVDELTALRPLSYTILGLAAAISPRDAAPIPPLVPMLAEPLANRARRVLERLCATLSAQLDAHAQDQWQWFEPMLSWGNARLPEALLRGAAALHDDRLAEAGMRALAFLASVTHVDGRFVPIGNRGWYVRGGERAVYDQQPIEACAMVDAWLAASRLTGLIRYESKALEAFSWFLGLNTERLALVDPVSGGCHDGLERGSVNLNMGAESTLSYIHSHAALAARFVAKTKVLESLSRTPIPEQSFRKS